MMDVFENLFYLFKWRGHGRRQKTGRTKAQLMLGNMCHAFTGHHQIHTRAAMCV